MKPHLRKIVGHSPCPMSGASSESRLMCNANVENVELQDKGNPPCCEVVSETDVDNFIPEDYVEDKKWSLLFVFSVVNASPNVYYH